MSSKNPHTFTYADWSRKHTRPYPHPYSYVHPQGLRGDGPLLASRSLVVGTNNLTKGS